MTPNYNHDYPQLLENALGRHLKKYIYKAPAFAAQ
jgi:hypothetical protein